MPWYYFTEYLGQGVAGDGGAVGGGMGAEWSLITSDFLDDDEPLTLASCFSRVLEVRPLIAIGCI